MSTITNQQLIEDGFKQDQDPHSSFPFNKDLDIRVPDDWEQPSLTVTRLYGSPRLAFSPGNGLLFFLNVNSLKEANDFVGKIQSIDPPY
jgi:hypothetical protein